MPKSSSSELAQRIYYAIHLVKDDDTPLDAHCFWELRSLMSRLDPEVDLLPSEVMAINVVLATANARKSSAPGGLPGASAPSRRVEPPLLRVVG